MNDDRLGVLLFWFFCMCIGISAGLAFGGVLAVACGQWIGLANVLFFGCGTLLIASMTRQLGEAVLR